MDNTPPRLIGLLPQEIQLMIWEVVIDNIPSAFLVIQPGLGDPDPHVLRSSRGVPSVLQVDHTSRRLALRTFQLSFGSVDGRPQYFNFARDTLHLRSMERHWEENYPAILPELAMVENLAVYMLREHLAYMYPFRLEAFLNLRTLSVGTERGLAGTWQGRGLYYLALFWQDSINPRREQSGLPAANTPVLIFLSNEQVIEFIDTTR